MGATPLPIEDADTPEAQGVVIVWLEQPQRSALVLDRALLERLDATLDAIGEHPRGVVVASRSTRVFVAGADLAEIQSLSDQDLDAYLAFGQRTLGRIAALGCTTVAAIDGAALGGGLELAMHCDRILALRSGAGGKPYQIGLPEATLGLCPGWGGTNLLPARLEPGVAIGMAAAGTTIPPSEAERLGLIDELLEDRDVLLASATRAAAAHRPKRSHPGEPPNVSMPEFADPARVALQRVERDLPEGDPPQAVLAAVRAGLTSGWREALRVERRELVRLRGTETARARLRAFFERTAGAKR